MTIRSDPSRPASDHRPTVRAVATAIGRDSTIAAVWLLGAVRFSAGPLAAQAPTSRKVLAMIAAQRWRIRNKARRPRSGLGSRSCSRAEPADSAADRRSSSSGHPTRCRRLGPLGRTIVTRRFAQIGAALEDPDVPGDAEIVPALSAPCIGHTRAGITEPTLTKHRVLILVAA